MYSYALRTCLRDYAIDSPSFVLKIRANDPPVRLADSGVSEDLDEHDSSRYTYTCPLACSWSAVVSAHLILGSIESPIEKRTTIKMEENDWAYFKLYSARLFLLSLHVSPFFSHASADTSIKISVACILQDRHK